MNCHGSFFLFRKPKLETLNTLVALWSGLVQASLEAGLLININIYIMDSSGNPPSAFQVPTPPVHNFPLTAALPPSLVITAMRNLPLSCREVGYLQSTLEWGKNDKPIRDGVYNSIVT